MTGFSTEDRHWMERYLLGELSGIELERFETRLKEDEAFRKETELQKIIYDGILLASEEQLQQKVLAGIRYRRSPVPYALRLIGVFVLVVVCFVSLWLYTGNETAVKQKSKTLFTLFNKEIADGKVQGKQNMQGKVGAGQLKQSVQKEQSGDTAVSKNSYKEEQVASAGDEWSPETDDTVSVPAPEAIVVKGDKLLASATLQVLEKQHGEEEEHSLSSGVAEKLNPAADLPERERRTVAYYVEFWSSPVNYRGYKMSKNKIILFGIDEPDAVKLYRLNQVIYLSYLSELYRLEETYDFKSYQKAREAEVQQVLR